MSKKDTTPVYKIFLQSYLGDLNWFIQDQQIKVFLQSASSIVQFFTSTCHQFTKKKKPCKIGTYNGNQLILARLSTASCCKTLSYSSSSATKTHLAKNYQSITISFNLFAPVTVPSFLTSNSSNLSPTLSTQSTKQIKRHEVVPMLKLCTITNEKRLIHAPTKSSL